MARAAIGSGGFIFLSTLPLRDAGAYGIALRGDPCRDPRD